MKSLLKVLRALINDPSVCCSIVNRDSDFNTIATRVEHEGLSFLTITLPSFCSDFDNCLKDGRVLSPRFCAFKHRGCLPEFLRGFTEHVFDSKGVLRDDADPAAIQLIRQVTRLCKKLEVDCTDSRVDAALDKYIATDVSLDSDHFDPARCDVLARLTELTGDIFHDIGETIRHMDVRPNNGPGAVATPRLSNQKWVMPSWSERLNDVFPLDHYACYSVDAYSSVASIDICARDQEPPVRVVTVRKNLKTPRIIAIEPVHQQFMQQGIKDELYALIESHPILGGHVNFTDQKINQELARRGSLGANLATIDLSEASDRVSKELVYLQYSRCDPDFLEGVMACRSTHAAITRKSGEVETYQLRKFASMGSALCFPIEAVAFFFICCGGLMESRGLTPCMRSLRIVAKDVYVYGDDIIVPADEVDFVIDWLEGFNLRVNHDKSFWTGKFRESCGAEYFDGTWVTPVYARQILRDKMMDPSLQSWVSLGNQLLHAGFWKASSVVRHEVERRTGFGLPVAHEDTPGLSWNSFIPSSYGGRKERWNTELSRRQVRTIVYRPVSRKDSLDGYPALLKIALQPSLERDVNHLHESVRRGAVAASLRWVPLTP